MFAQRKIQAAGAAGTTVRSSPSGDDSAVFFSEQFAGGCLGPTAEPVDGDDFVLLFEVDDHRRDASDIRLVAVHDSLRQAPRQRQRRSHFRLLQALEKQRAMQGNAARCEVPAA